MDLRDKNLILGPFISPVEEKVEKRLLKGQENKTVNRVVIPKINQHQTYPIPLSGSSVVVGWKGGADYIIILP